MTDIRYLRDRYFVDERDINPLFLEQDSLSGFIVPHTSAGNDVQYLLSGPEYFRSIRITMESIAGTDGAFIYFANWYLGLVDGPSGIIETDPPVDVLSAWLGDLPRDQITPSSAFTLDDGSLLIDRITNWILQGVDVRCMVWINPLLLFRETAMQSYFYWIYHIHSMMSIKELRSQNQSEQNKFLLNTLGHSIGSVHMKMCIIGNRDTLVAYLSGLDPEESRMAEESWHDAGVRIEGNACSSVYEFYRNTWNELRGREPQIFRIEREPIASHFVDTPEVPELASSDRPFDLASLEGRGTQEVQILRTVPQMNFRLARGVPDVEGPQTEADTELASQMRSLGCCRRILSGFRQDSWSFAPDGVFEFGLSIKKAISGADHYIYIEDQGFKGLEIMEWINDRLLENPLLKVILVYGSDPVEDTSANLDAAMSRLIFNIDDPDDRIVFYTFDEKVIHSKLWIIDDIFALVGSANFQRRSIYTDVELSAAVLDDVEGNNRAFAQRLRHDLWARHFQSGPPNRPRSLNVSEMAQIKSLGSALGIWNPLWGPPVGRVRPHENSIRMRIPFEYSTDPAPHGVWTSESGREPEFSELLYYIDDFDSRERI